MGISAPAFLALGAWLALAVPAFAQAADDPARDPAVRAVRDAFRIEGLGLFDARPARAPGCADSAVAGMTWCGGAANYVTAESGTYTRSLGYNVDAAGRVVYIILTRREFPLARAGFDDMLRTLGARYGRPPTTVTFQGETGDGEDFFSLVAVWGAIKLVRLNDAESRAVAEGRAVGRGHLVDHRQDVRLSARQRDPVYKIEGTAGFIAELRSMTDVRTDVVLRAVFQPAFIGEPAAATPEAAPQYRILPLDPPLAYAIETIRAEEERLAAIERARRAEEERKAAEERRIEAERKAAEERRLAEERRIEAERKAAEERKLAEERAAEEERARRAEAERKAAEERRAMEEKARKEAAERKAAEERARREEAERKAAEVRRLAEERARREEAERKAAEERRVIEERFRRAEAEYKASVERARRAEAERKAAEERAQQAETERRAAEERAKRIEAERKAADERRAEERAEERRAEERRITEERARREEAERKAAAERARREDVERKTAESKSREERRAAEDRARRPEGEREDTGRQAESVRTPPAESDRPKPEARRIAEEPSPRPAEPKIAGAAPGVGGPAPGREEWLRMAIAQSRNSTANWVFERLRDRISDDALVQARAVFAVGDRLALEIAFECNIDAGKRLRAHVRAFDARTNAAIPIPPEDGRTSVARGSVTLDEDVPQTAFMFPERDERQASIVEIPVTDDDIRKNTARAQVWLRHFRVAIKFRVAQGEAAATIYPYSENLRRVLEACSS